MFSYSRSFFSSYITGLFFTPRNENCYKQPCSRVEFQVSSSVFAKEDIYVTMGLGCREFLTIHGELLGFFPSKFSIGIKKLDLVILRSDIICLL